MSVWYDIETDTLGVFGWSDDYKKYVYITGRYEGVPFPCQIDTLKNNDNFVFIGNFR